MSLVFAPGIVLKWYNIISIVIHFLNFTSKSKTTEAKISQQDYIKLRSSAKETTNHQQNEFNNDALKFQVPSLPPKS